MTPAINAISLIMRCHFVIMFAIIAGLRVSCIIVLWKMIRKKLGLEMWTRVHTVLFCRCTGSQSNDIFCFAFLIIICFFNGVLKGDRDGTTATTLRATAISASRFGQNSHLRYSASPSEKNSAATITSGTVGIVMCLKRNALHKR